MSVTQFLDKIMGQEITIYTKDRKKARMYVQISQKGLYLKITRGKKNFIALIPKKEVHKLIAPALAEFIAEPNEIDAVWKFVVKSKKSAKKKMQKKEEKEEELELL